MRGFQLWINLPAKEKMKPAGYRVIQPDEIPVIDVAGARVKVIAGVFGKTPGPVKGGSTDPIYWDVSVPAGKTFTQEIPKDHTVYVYPFEGNVEIGDRVLRTHCGGVLGAGDSVEIRASEEGARFLLLAGRPLREPVVQYGPFVMNTREEVEQAIRDYQNGVLAV